MACLKGHIQIVKWIIEEDYLATNRLDELNGALLEAAMDGHLEVVKLLLHFGANVEARFENKFESALTIASTGGHVHLVCLLSL